MTSLYMLYYNDFWTPGFVKRKKKASAHLQSIPGWGGFHHDRCWPLGSRTCQLCSGSRKQRALRAELCWASSLQSRASWNCRRCGLFWFQLCRELEEKEREQCRAAETRFTRCWKSTQTCSPQYWARMPAAPAGGQPFHCFSALTPADWLGRPVSCVLALYFSMAVKNVVISAAIFNLLLIAVRPHHSKGDEAVGDPCWDWAAHL